MNYYDYRSYFNELIQNTDNIDSNHTQLYNLLTQAFTDITTKQMEMYNQIILLTGIVVILLIITVLFKNA